MGLNIQIINVFTFRNINWFKDWNINELNTDGIKFRLQPTSLNPENIEDFKDEFQYCGKSQKCLGSIWIDSIGIKNQIIIKYYTVGVARNF